jgi:hypothetical protein
MFVVGCGFEMLDFWLCRCWIGSCNRFFLLGFFEEKRGFFLPRMAIAFFQFLAKDRWRDRRKKTYRLVVNPMMECWKNNVFYDTKNQTLPLTGAFSQQFCRHHPSSLLVSFNWF